MNNIIYFHDWLHIREGGCMCEILRKLCGKTAEDLLSIYEIPMSAPIPLSLLCKRIGVAALEKDFSDIEDKYGLGREAILGAAVSFDNDLAIFYRNKDTYNRQRFTIAHELGHCCLHSKNLEINHIEFRTDDVDDEKEKSANIFAGELLIPKKLLLDTCDKFIIPTLSALAEIFQVSINVMKARLDYLGIKYYKDV